MANNIEMITFAGQTVTPLDDALIYDSALSSGILSGCNVSLSGGNTIHMEGGHGIICGRKFTVFESDIPVPLSSGATLNGRLKIHMDLSDTGEPLQLIVESAATLPALEQDEDANINNGIYEFNIATFSVTTSAVTNFAQVFPRASINPDFIVNNMTTPAATSGKALDARQANPAIAGTLAALVAAKVAKTDIVNNGATAAGTSGKVLDARQANPAISGSLAQQISALNSRLGVLSVAQSAVNASSTAEVSVEKGLYLLICYHVGNNVNGMYLVNAFAGSYGSYRTVPVLDNANIAVSNSAFVLTIQNKYASDKLNYVLVRLTDIM